MNMRMKTKKIIAILLAIMVLLSLAACARGEGTADNTGNDELVQNPAAESQPQEQTEVSAETGEESGQFGAADTALDSVAQEQTSESDITQESDPNSSVLEPAGEPEGSKILVAYFSATNNTEGVAQKLADGLGADLYEITPEQPYTEEDLDYGNSQSRSSVEMDDPDARPAISGSVENMGQYDVVLIGYPIWWGEAPRIMSTFMESYDFSGKTLAAFCTSASSGFGSSDSALRSATDGATWLDGQRFPAGASAEDVMEWADGLGIK